MAIQRVLGRTHGPAQEDGQGAAASQPRMGTSESAGSQLVADNVPWFLCFGCRALNAHSLTGCCLLAERKQDCQKSPWKGVQTCSIT